MSINKQSGDGGFDKNCSCNQVDLASGVKRNRLKVMVFRFRSKQKNPKNASRSQLISTFKSLGVVSVWFAVDFKERFLQSCCLYSELHVDLVLYKRNVSVASAQTHTVQMVLGVPLMLRSSKSSMWLHMATNRSKNNLPPISISICMVPLRLNVFRLRIIRAK